MVPYAHWITPFVEKKRFDTRFFLARVPDGQVPLHDAVEMTESLWIHPDRALDAYRLREIRLMPPTLKTLTELCRFGDTTALFQVARGRRIVPILPQACSLDGMATLLLPHDPAYGIDGFRQPPRPDEPSRIVFRDKLWQLI
jgi:hypothetical protein